MDWLDRITGERRPVPVAPFAPGQWQYCGGRRFVIRDAEACPGDVLMPGQDGRCFAPSLGPIRCDPHFVPDDDALRSLRLAGDRLRALETRSWSAWVAETPVLPALDDALEETPLERVTAAKLGYLEAVCAHPRTHLRLEEERLAVERCKRLSVRAPIALAARSEDWERRTLWGVRPRRVLGIVREELYDIYENRVAVALVDNLEAALLRRLRSVRRVVALLRQRESYQHVLEDSQNYRRASRILELWSEAWEDSGQLAHAEAVQRRLLGLRRRVLALKDTLLYRQIGGHGQGRMQLRMTNVLTHDDVYRRIAELWIAWEDQTRLLSGDPAVRWRQDQDAASGFSRFVFLVIVRALDSLGYRVADGACDTPMGAEGEWLLTGPAGLVRLRRDGAGVSVHATHAAEPLKIVSVPGMLEASSAIGEWANRTRGRAVVVAVLPADEPRASVETRIKLGTYANWTEGDLSLVSVAPWDIESVERVARRIRWYAWSSLYGCYPFGVQVPDNWTLPGSTPPWMRSRNGALHIVRPPAAHEARWGELDARVEEATRQVGVAQTKLDQCNPRDPRDNRKRLHLRQELDVASAELRSAEEVTAGLTEAIARTALFLPCPVCRTSANVREFDCADALFRCECSECKATWGRRTCEACHGLFAFLDFPGNEPTDYLLDADRRFGSDVLAIPVADQVYLCPHCGRPTDRAAHG